MSATGLEVLDKSLQTTNIWLKEIMEAVGPDRHVAWRVLGAVLHALRDRLAVEQVAHLGAELPIVIRGLYYDQWHPAGKPGKERRADEFVARVNAELRAALTQLVRPHVAIVTAIASAHREFFPNEEAIADAKAEIFQGLEPDGTAIVPFDSPHRDRLIAAAEKLGLNVIQACSIVAVGVSPSAL